MSNTMKWVGVSTMLAIGVLAVWEGGVVSGFSPASQSAALVAGLRNVSTTTTAAAVAAPVVTDAGLVQDAANIDAQIQLVATGSASLEKDLSTNNVVALAAQIQSTAMMMAKLSNKLQTRLTSEAAAGAPLQGALRDLNRAMLNAGSQATVAVKNTTAKAGDAASLQQAKTQLQAAQTYLQTARGDIQTILAGLQKR